MKRPHCNIICRLYRVHIYNNNHVTCLSGSDYQSGPYSVTFDAEMTRTSFNVLVNDDNTSEANETFELAINMSSLPNDVTIGVPGRATVTIVDDDGKYINLINFMIYILSM